MPNPDATSLLLRSANDGTLKEGFGDYIRDALVVLGMSERELADSMLISRPTLLRWIEGKSLPATPRGREAAIKFIGDLIKQKAGQDP